MDPVLLPRLSAVQAAEQAPVVGCVESPGAHCGLFEAALTGPLFADACTLLIGAPACLYHARMTLLPRTLGPAGLKDNLLLVPMDQADTVFGVEDRLVEAVLEADRRFRPRMLFLVGTCIPEMVGADLEAVVHMAQAQVQARLLPVRTDGFSGKHQLLGHRRLLAALARAMEPRPVRPRSVNILGLRGNAGVESELVRLLRRWGAEVLCVVPAETAFAQVQQAPAAALNLLAGEMGLDLAQEMERRFGTPYLHVGQPLHPEQVAQTYAAVAAALGLAPGAELEALAAEAGEAMQAARRAAEGLRCAVGTFMGGALGAARFLVDLGLEPAIIFLNRLTLQDRTAREALLARGIDPLVAQSRSSLDTAAVLAALRPQVYAGHGDPSAMARLGIAHIHPDPARALWGFEATRWAAAMVEHAACQPPLARKGARAWP